MRTVISTEEMQDAKLIACGFGICEDDEEVGAYLHGVLDGWGVVDDGAGPVYMRPSVKWSYNTGVSVGAKLKERRRIKP